MSGSGQVRFEGGPRDGQEEAWTGPLPTSIGDGSHSGVYEPTDNGRNVRVYRWHAMTADQAGQALEDAGTTLLAQAR